MSLAKAATALLAAIAGTLLWPEGWTDRGFRPDFPLLLAVGAGLFGGARAGCLAGMAAGLLAAPLTLDPFGLDAALLGIAGVGAARAAVYLSGGHPGVQSAVAALAALAAGLLRLAILVATGSGFGALGTLPAVLAGVAATAAAAPVALFLLDVLGVFRERREEGRLTLV